MRLNTWMTNFYNYDWWELDFPPKKIVDKGMYEWKINPSDFVSISISKKFGFDLVETLVEFETEVSPNEEKFVNLRLSSNEDVPSIVDLTIDSYSNNSNFYNRFKNVNYFSNTQRDNYYKLSIENNFFDPNTITVVYETDQSIKGFYMFKRIEGSRYKGIMTAVDSQYRGLGLHIKMQQFCFNLVGKPITTINTTQLNNFNIINNHIKEGRKLSDVKHIFYKKI